MSTIIQLGGLAVEVVKKDIKNLHLGVYPPAGLVRISAPKRMKLETIRVFAISKLGWIKQQQKKLQTQEREPPREYLDRESHYVWGKRYLLRVVEEEAPPLVEIKHNKLWLRVRPGAGKGKRREILEDWYRGLVKEAVPSIIARWEQRLRVTIDRFYVRRMKTKWGSCTPTARSIRLNTDLAKKPLECLEYIVAHELLHIQTRHHDERFTRLMDLHLPGWRVTRQILNATPLTHENWKAEGIGQLHGAG